MPRLEQDSLGVIEVGSSKYWGAQTQRSLENFAIGNQRFSRTVIKVLGIVKKAAACANYELKKLGEEKKRLISNACDEVIEGKLDEHFPLVVWQTGSGTQTNMNANEVIANRANEMCGEKLGGKTPIHPNDDVNCSQSSNDLFPTVMHIATLLDIKEKLLPALESLIATFQSKSRDFQDIVKIGRTHMMDATPLTLGQEIGAYAAQLIQAKEACMTASASLLPLPIGGTAVGTGLNSPPNYDQRAVAHIAELTSLPFGVCENKFSLIAAHDTHVYVSGALKMLAVACMKIANDVRMLASGPRCGIGELILPTNEPGSSIMPGKVNPTQCEALTMICAQVMGNDAAISVAASQGHFQLNVFKPMILHNTIETIDLLSGAISSFHKNCAKGIEANRKVISKNLENSLMLITALNPVIGYDRAAKIAKTAYQEDLTLLEATLKLGYLSEEEFSKYVNPSKMV